LNEPPFYGSANIFKTQDAVEWPIRNLATQPVPWPVKIETALTVPISSVPALKLQNRQHYLLFGDCCLKKNVFENFQKVALNITVMDDISHQILQKLNDALCHFVAY
jgi:hypothetical protein